MSRLINATTLRAEFTGNFQELWHYTSIWAMIDIAPTVFDVDKVIEEVHAYFESVIDKQDGEEIPHEILRYNKDICKIIRDGGVKKEE